MQFTGSCSLSEQKEVNRMDELRDILAAVLIVLAFFAIAGFAGWMTDYEDAPIQYQIQQRWIGDNTKGVRT